MPTFGLLYASTEPTATSSLYFGSEETGAAGGNHSIQTHVACPLAGQAKAVLAGILLPPATGNSRSALGGLYITNGAISATGRHMPTNPGGGVPSQSRTSGLSKSGAYPKPQPCVSGKSAKAVTKLEEGIAEDKRKTGPVSSACYVRYRMCCSFRIILVKVSMPGLRM